MKSLFKLSVLQVLSMILAISQEVILGLFIRNDVRILSIILVAIYFILPYFIYRYIRKYFAKKYVVVSLQFILYLVYSVLAFIKIPEFFPKIVDENNGMGIILLAMIIMNLLSSFCFFILGTIENKQK
jgi:hypothetical protein